MKPRSIKIFITILIAAAAFGFSVRAVVRSMNAESNRPSDSLRQAIAEKEDPDADDPVARLNFDALRYGDPNTGMIPADMRKKELAFASGLPTREYANSLLQKNGTAAAIVSSSWTRRGPVNVGGRTRALGIDVANSSTILAGGVSGGMWRSTNGGAAWTKTTDPNELQSVTCLAQDKRPGKTAVWYYGTGELVGNSASRGGAPYRGEGIFKSTDDGATWSRLPSTGTHQPEVFNAPWDYVWDLAADASNTSQDVVYAATIGAIMRSADGGATWSAVLGGTSDTTPRFTDVAIDPNGIAYAAMSDLNMNLFPGAQQAGLWRSQDGVNWKNITPQGFPSSGFKRFVIAIAPTSPNNVFFLGETPGSGLNDHSLWKYTYLSGDGTGAGGAWENRSANLPNQAGLASNGAFDSQGSYDLACIVKPDNPEMLFIGGVNLYRSSDAFHDTLQTVRIGGYASPTTYASYQNNHPDHHVLRFDPTFPNILYNGNDGGVFKTTDATLQKVAWTSLNNGYYSTQFYTVAIDHAVSSSSIIGGMQDNGTWMTRSSSGDAAWNDVFDGDGAYCAIASSSSSFYVSSQNGDAYRFIISPSNSIADYADITPVGGTGFLFVNPFTLDPNDLARMYMCGGNILWRNNDLTSIPLASKSASAANNPTRIGWDSLSFTRVNTATITFVAVSAVPANRVYYSTSAGEVYRIDNAQTGNPVPVNVSAGKGLPSPGYINQMAINPADGNNVLVVISNYNIQSLFVTTDGGTTWSPVGGNLEQNPDGSGNGPSTRCAAIIPIGQQTFYLVGTSVGLFSTTALAGVSTVWAQEGASTIGALPVDMIDWRASDRTVVVATHGGGVFSGTIVTGLSQLAVELPTTFLLRQNFPNPFNPETTIRYTIPADGLVRLNVYDADGKLVAGLVNGDQPSGTYEVRWDGRTLSGGAAASGVYYARLEHEGRSQTTKMILQR
jgi:photosystem II stability/assembly factor-like uncharacterized protein